MFIELDFPREILEMGSQTGRAGRFLVRDWDELERYWKGKNGSGSAYVRTSRKEDRMLTSLTCMNK